MTNIAALFLWKLLHQCIFFHTISLLFCMQNENQFKLAWQKHKTIFVWLKFGMVSLSLMWCQITTAIQADPSTTPDTVTSQLILTRLVIISTDWGDMVIASHCESHTYKHTWRTIVFDHAADMTLWLLLDPVDYKCIDTLMTGSQTTSIFRGCSCWGAILADWHCMVMLHSFSLLANHITVREQPFNTYGGEGCA